MDRIFVFPIIWVQSSHYTCILAHGKFNFKEQIFCFKSTVIHFKSLNLLNLSNKSHYSLFPIISLAVLLAFSQNAFAQVELDRFHNLEEVPQYVIDQRIQELIEGGFITQSEQELQSFTSANNSLLQYTFYSGNQFGSDTRSTRGMEFNPTGTRMYVVGRSSNNVIEYHLSTPWDIRTASYQREFDTTAIMQSQTQPEGNTHGIYIRQQDGTKMWIVNRTEIWEFTLSTAWNITTASPTGFYDLSNKMLRAHGIDFKPDGSRMFLEDRFLGSVFQYNLSTPWDVESATLDHTYKVPVQQDLQGVQFFSDGLRLFLIDNDAVMRGLEEIHEFTLTTAYDLRTASYIGSFSLSDTPNATSLKFRPDFKQLFVSDPGQNRIFMYDILFPPDSQRSTITALTDRVQANDSSTSRIRVVMRNSDGATVEKLPVRLISKSGRLDYTPETAITDANGQAFFEVKNNRPETVTYSAVSLGVELAATTSVRFLGIDPDLSFITVTNTRIQSNRNQVSLIRITTKDEENNPFGSVNVELITDGGNPDVEIIRSISDANGESEFRISSQNPGTTLLRARTMGITLSDTPSIRFLGIDPDLSTLEISSTRIQANQNQKSSAIITAKDEDNNPFGNVKVELLTDGGSSIVDVLQHITNSSGQARFDLSSQNPGFTQVGARILGTSISDTKIIQFLGIDPEISTFLQSDERVQADGREQAEILVHVRDEDNNPFGNVSMELIPDGGSSVIDPFQPVTDQEGIARFRVSNEIIERVSYQARGLGTTLSSSVSIQFIPLAPVALSATNVETRSFRANWELVEGAATYFFDLSADSTFSSYLPGYENLDVGLTTSLEIVNLQPGSSYYYRVRASKENLTGADSETITVHTFPDTPVAVSSTDRNANQFRARWESAEGSAGYSLDVALDPEFSELLPEYKDLDVGNQLSHLVTGLELDTEYFYRVRAVAGPRTSAESNVIQVSTLDLNRELSSIEQQQLRILANGDQTNRITIQLKSSEGIALQNVQTSLIPDSGQVTIEEINAVTDEEGTSSFELSSLQAGKVTFTVRAQGNILDTFDVEFLPAIGQLALGNNYPNPFRNETTIPVTIPEQMHVEIRVYDRLGRYIQTVVREEMMPGYYEIPFRSSGLASGVYFYRLITPLVVLDETMVLVK